MSAQTIMLLLVIGLLAGIISGLVGVGGGIIIVPALVLLLGFTQQQAQGTSLGLLLLPVGILAVWNYYQKGRSILRLYSSWLWHLPSGWLGSKLALSISQADLKKSFRRRTYYCRNKDAFSINKNFGNIHLSIILHKLKTHMEANRSTAKYWMLFFLWLVIL